MDTIGKQKALADRIVNRLKDECGFYTLLAGGAPRDWLIGLPANDLDFYIQCESGEAEEVVEKIQKALDIDLGRKEGEDYEAALEDMGTPLNEVYEGNFLGMITVQFMLIQCPPKEYVTDYFDLSICKVWYEDGDIHTTWQYRLSKENEIIVVEFPQSDRHLDKLLERDEWGRYRVVGWGGWSAFLTLLNVRAPRHDFVNLAAGGVAAMEVQF